MYAVKSSQPWGNMQIEINLIYERALNHFYLKNRVGDLATIVKMTGCALWH